MQDGQADLPHELCSCLEMGEQGTLEDDDPIWDDHRIAGVALAERGTFVDAEEHFMFRHPLPLKLIKGRPILNHERQVVESGTKLWRQTRQGLPDEALELTWVRAITASGGAVGGESIGAGPVHLCGGSIER